MVMEKRRKRKLRSQLCSFGLIVCIGVLFMSSCQNPLDPGHDGNNPKESQMGTLLLTITSLTDNVQQARTIFPDTYPTIAEYYIAFTPESGQAAKDPVTATTSTPTIELEVGDWTISVEGRESSGGPTVAQGATVTPVTVGTGTTSASLEITPTVTGTGEVNLTIDWSQVTKPVTVSSVDYYLYGITDLQPQNPVAIDPSGGTSITVNGSYASGDYRLELMLRDASTNLLSGVSELVKIYDNITTSSTIYLIDNDIQSPPTAPSALTASASLSTQIDLSWTDNSVTDTGYKIERSTTSGTGFSQIATVDANVSSYTDDNGGAGLNPGTTYYYRIRAYNTFGDSSYCAEASATTLGSLEFTITIDSPTDETITFDQNDTIMVHQSQSVTVTITESFAAFAWYLDGDVLSGEENNYVTVTGSGETAGAHVLMALVTKNGNIYSKSVQIFIYNSLTSGDTGPAGGLVFYDKGGYSDGWRYLEAAPASTEWSGIGWGAEGINVNGADGTAVGTGKQNTIDIIATIGTGSTYAAQLCDGLIYGGYDDWFLPSKDEIDLMYDNLFLGGLGDFLRDYYWSSSEYLTSNAWRHDFDTRLQSYGEKAGSLVVRAIRAF